MDEPNIKTALKNVDLDPVHLKVRDILEGGKGLVDHQKSEIYDEDVAAQEQILSSRKYYYMTVVQIVVIVGLGMYQLLSFRKFLGSNQII